MTALLALAFAAGMIAPVNPCGFALLPAWIAQTIGDARTRRLLPGETVELRPVMSGGTDG